MQFLCVNGLAVCARELGSLNGIGVVMKLVVMGAFALVNGLFSFVFGATLNGVFFLVRSVSLLLYGAREISEDVS